MEEDEIDLNNIVKVLWKRKKLIIVVTLICMFVGGGVTSLRSSLTYRSEAVIKIGKKVVPIELSKGVPSLKYSEQPEELEKTIPVKYSPGNKENISYHIDAERIDASSMIRIIIKSPGRGTEKPLNEIVNRLIDDCNRIEDASLSQYKDAITILEERAEGVQDNIVVADSRLKELNVIDKVTLDIMAVEWEKGIAEDIYLMGPLLQGVSNFGNRITIEEKVLKREKNALEDTQENLRIHQTFLRNLNGYNTKMIGEVKSSVVEPQKLRSTMMCVVIGLALSLFLVFILECVRAKVEGKKDLA